MLLAVSNKLKLGNKLLLDLEQTLPEGWAVQLRPGQSSKGPDALLEINSPSGTRTVFAIEEKLRFEPRDVDYVERQFALFATQGSPLLITPALSGRSRELLKQRNVSYADCNGNIRLSSDGFFIDRESGAKNFENARSNLQRSSLRGPITGRLIRYLLDARPPLKVRDIAYATNVNPGNVSRLLKLLERERLINREGRGMVANVDWEALIRQWSEALKRDRHYSATIEPHGIETFTRYLRTKMPYAITGSYGAALIAPAARASSIDVHVESADLWIRDIGLRIAEGYGNIRLIEAFDEVVFERTLERNGLIVANPSQVAADLLTLPKRSDDEYDSLINWMKHNESSWRVA